MDKFVKKAKNFGLITMTCLAAWILLKVLGTIGLPGTNGMLLLEAGTLATAWITLFALANILEIDEKKERPSKTIARTHQSHY